MIYIINKFDPRMVKRNLQVKIFEFPSIEEFRKLVIQVIIKNEFQINLQKDIFKTFSSLMGIDIISIRPGPHLSLEELEENDVAFCVRPDRDTIFRYYFISITKPQPIRKHCHEKKNTTK